MRPKKYQTTRRVNFLIASAFLLAALLFPAINRAAVQILIGISLTPPATTIAVGQSKQFTALLQYADGSSQNASGSGTWVSAGSLATARQYHTATRLADGSVLVAGGLNGATNFATAERYNPATGLWVPAGTMSVARAGHTATLLPTGKVLVVGGAGFALNGVLGSTELYDPFSNTWSAGPNLIFGPRSQHSAVALNDGNVLIAAGLRFGNDCQYHITTELYNWMSNSWSAPGALHLARSNATTAVLPGGKVLLAGGPANNCPTPNNGLGQAEVYDPIAQAWTVVGAMSMPRFTNFIATMPSGKVLLAGGRTAGGTTSSADVFNPATALFSLTTSMSVPRATSGGTGDNGSTVVLPDGRVLVAGGTDVFSGTTYSSAELYDPATATWSPTASMQTARVHNTITTLDNGSVLVAGGAQGALTLASAELYQPQLVWSSSNTAVATVDQNGLATAVGVGQTTISAQSGSISGGTLLTVANDQVPPATTAGYAAPNTNGWHTTDVIVQLDATDSGGPVPASGVKTITYSLNGAQSGGSTGNGNSLSFSISNEGITNATYFATDNDGNVEAATTITIRIDRTPPTLPHLPNLVFNAMSTAGAFVTFPTTAFDTVSGVDTVTVTQGPASGSTFPIGTTNVQVTAVDNAGNQQAQSFTVTVNPLVPFININTNSFTYDGNPHPATATVSGQNGAPVNGTLSFTYSPGGASEPVNAGAYGVTATFTSNDSNYANAVASIGATPAGGTWSMRANIPTGRYGAPTAVINNKVYVAGGCCIGGSLGITRYNSLEVFDQQSNSWTSKSPIPTGVYGAGAAAINGTFYVAGGQVAGGNVNNLQAYDPVNDQWTAKTPMPDASSGVGAAVINNQMFVIGGMDPSNNFMVNHVRRYDPTSNSWSARAPMPTAREFMGVATQNNRIYAVGGYAGGTPLSKLEVYDPNSDTWSTKASMPTARYGLTVEFLNGTLYAIGGNGGPAGVYQPLATVEAYDPNTDTWSSLSPAPNTHYLAAAGQVFGTLYLISGVDAAGANTTRNEAFAPDRLLRINQRQPQISVMGGTFPYDKLPHPATATATGLGGTAVAGTFAINYSPGGSQVPVTPGFYGVNATFTSADPNYQSGGSGFGNVQITRQSAIVNVPADITVDAHAGDDSAQVNFVVTAHDIDGPLIPNCFPSSGSFFNSGVTTVNCNAQGINSSQGFGSFHVTVNEPTLESIAVTTADGQSSASSNVNESKQFVATATFSNGETLSTAGDQGGSGNGGSGGGGSGGGGGSTPSVGFWNVHFTPGLDVSACGGIGGGAGFSSQAFSVDSNGVINNTQWSPGTPRVNVTGQVTPNVQVTLTLSCINDPGITTTVTLPWQTTSFDGSITFSGQTTSAHVTGWSSQPSMPTATFASGAATINNKMYVVGGSVNGAPSGLMQIFDLTARTWSTSPVVMSPREGPGVAALNGYLYAAGGHIAGGAATSTLQRFDPAANAWVTLASMPTARAELQLVAANGKLYAVGGQAGNGTPLNTVEQYDPGTDQWSARAPMSSSRMLFAAGALNNGTTIIAAGGAGSSVELYDLAADTWSPTSPLQTSMAAGVTIANRFYVATQCGSFVYRPAAGSVTEGWALMPNMLHPRGEFAVAASGDAMFTAGGFTGSNPPSAVATFDALSTPAPGDLFYNQGGAGTSCSGSGGGGDDGGDDGEGPAWRIVDPVTHQNSPVATIDASGLATGVMPGTVLVVAEFGGVSCLDSNECATLTVLDSEPPTITAPAAVTAEATSAAGAIVDPGEAIATDDSGPVTITRSPTGNQFALGTTTITWRATDGGGNFAEATQTVTVVDTTRPVLTLPDNITIDATSPQGAIVIYPASATDSVDGIVPVICSNASGTVVPIGTTTVSCTATDAAGNTASGSFTVLVQAAAAQVSQLIVTVQNFNLQQGISNSLDAKLQNVLEALNGATAGNTAAVCNQLAAFINETAAQSGKKLTVAQANQLIATAQQIRAVIGCQ